MLDESPTRFLSVGVVLQFIFPADGEDIQCSGALLGWKENGFLITEWPQYKGRPVEVSDQAPCVVRYLTEGRMVGFRTEVCAVQHVPEPLLFLVYPTKIEQVVLRKNPRVLLSQPISLIRGDQRPIVVTGVMRDLSSAGCRIETGEGGYEFPVDTGVRMEFGLPGVGHISNLTGSVRNVSVQGRRMVLGVEFQYHQLEFIEFHGWGGTVKKAIEQFVSQRHRPVPEPEYLAR